MRIDARMTLDEFRKSTPNTELMKSLTAEYLERLERGQCEVSDQPMAAAILGEYIRRAENMARAANQTARILAEGLERERVG